MLACEVFSFSEAAIKEWLDSALKGGLLKRFYFFVCFKGVDFITDSLP